MKHCILVSIKGNRLYLKNAYHMLTPLFDRGREDSPSLLFDVQLFMRFLLLEAHDAE